MTWVTYDRENKMVLAAAGGTWSLQDGKYKEACEFATDDVLHERGKTTAYESKIDRETWTITGGPNAENQFVETWKRVK